MSFVMKLQNLDVESFVIANMHKKSSVGNYPLRLHHMLIGSPTVSRARAGVGLGLGDYGQYTTWWWYIKEDNIHLKPKLTSLLCDQCSSKHYTRIGGICATCNCCNDNIAMSYLSWFPMELKISNFILRFLWDSKPLQFQVRSKLFKYKQLHILKKGNEEYIMYPLMLKITGGLEPKKKTFIQHT